MAAWSAVVVVLLLLLDGDGRVHTDVDALAPEQGLGLELLVPVLGLRLVHIQLTLLRREGLPAPHDLGHARLAGERATREGGGRRDMAWGCPAPRSSLPWRRQCCTTLPGRATSAAQW